MLQDKDIKCPLIYKGKEHYDYGVHKKLGGIYSKKTGVWKKMASSTNSTSKLKKAGKKGYLQSTLSLKKGKFKTVYVHIATHETLNPEFPTPPGVTENEWKSTPKSVKKWCRDGYQVNHINHDTFDYRPENLEWTTATQNVEAWKKHYRKEAA